MIINYLLNPDEYIQKISLGEKNRKIITYKKNRNGLQLRKSHENTLKLIKSSKSSIFSFAYKKNISTKNALMPHINSNLFIKMDISSFFESIKLDAFLDHMGDEFKYKEEIKECFYNNSLPIGFVTSPKISDMYLYEFDQEIEKFLLANPSVFYSRYCDDIMISTTQNDYSVLHTLRSFIEKKLLKLGLKTNKNKYREFDIEVDKTITFLGLNITIKNNERVISISKSFIVKTLIKLKEYYELIDKKRTIRKELKDSRIGLIGIEEEALKAKIAEFKRINGLIYFKHYQICSRVAYIHYNSLYAYKYFLKKHINWFGFEWARIRRS